jgi:DNA polymerase-4
MDAFFAEVELLDRPELRGRPVVVGGERRGVVLSATYEARAGGVHAAMSMRQARALCPSAVVVAPDHRRYREVSAAVMAILAEVTPVLERVSIDEAFLDVSGARRRLGSPARIGDALRARIRAETGVPASVGVAATKFVAKLASTHAKPDGLLLVPRTASVAFLHSLPIGALWGVGERTAERLAGRGVRTVEELAHVPVDVVERLLGRAAGRRLHDLAWGRDPRAVEPVRHERSVGSERTFGADVTEAGELLAALLEQSDGVAVRLRATGVLARTVTLKLRRADYSTLTRSLTLEAPTDTAHDVYTAARRLLAGIPVPDAGVRLVGVRAERLVDAAGVPVQAALDERHGPGRREAERAVDRVRARYGLAAVGPASLVPRAATERAIGDLS